MSIATVTVSVTERNTAARVNQWQFDGDKHMLRSFLAQMNHALTRNKGKTAITSADVELLRRTYATLTGEYLTNSQL